MGTLKNMGALFLFNLDIDNKHAIKEDKSTFEGTHVDSA